VVTTGFANLSDGAKVIIGSDSQTPTADLAPRKKGSRGSQTNGTQAKDGKAERQIKKGENGQTDAGAAQGGEQSGSGAKSR
jgi:multidrug efflux system membrane fusion protein